MTANPARLSFSETAVSLRRSSATSADDRGETFTRLAAVVSPSAAHARAITSKAVLAAQIRERRGSREVIVEGGKGEARRKIGETQLRFRRARTPSASVANTGRVCSHERQASVMLRPGTSG